MNEQGQRWFPSRRQQAADWYLRRLMRYGVGGGSIVWELAIDKGHNLFVLIVGGMLASTTDVLGIVRALIAQAKLEKRSLEDLVTQEMRDER